MLLSHASTKSNNLAHLLLTLAFLVHVVALLDHQPYGRSVMWTSLLLKAHSWRYNNT